MTVSKNSSSVGDSTDLLSKKMAAQIDNAAATGSEEEGGGTQEQWIRSELTNVKDIEFLG